MREYATFSPYYWIGETGRQLRGDMERRQCCTVTPLLVLILATYLSEWKKPILLHFEETIEGTMSDETGRDFY